MALLERVAFTVSTVDVMGVVPLQAAATFDRVVGVTSYSGPAGPFPIARPPQAVLYGGQLTNGNHFGSCEVIVSGAFQKRIRVENPPPSTVGPGGGAAGTFVSFLNIFVSVFRERYRWEWIDGNFIATADMTIRPPLPPVFTPDPLPVPRGKPGPHADFRVRVTPAGPYEIVLSVPDPEARAGLFVPTIVRTDRTGEGGSYIQDLIDAQRGPITIKATISPQAPCRGAPVETTFTVNVT